MFVPMHQLFGQRQITAATMQLQLMPDRCLMQHAMALSKPPASHSSHGEALQTGHRETSSCFLNSIKSDLCAIIWPTLCIYQSLAGSLNNIVCIRTSGRLLSLAHV